MPRAEFFDFGEMADRVCACGEPLHLVQYRLYYDGHDREMMWTKCCHACRKAWCTELEDAELQDEMRQAVLPVVLTGSIEMKWQKTHYNYEPEGVGMELGQIRKCQKCQMDSKVLVEQRRRKRPVFYRFCACGNTKLGGDELVAVRKQYERLTAVAEKFRILPVAWHMS